MKKSDKKLEKVIRETLTEVCDIALETVPGFCWITHKVDFSRFPDSLKVIAIFEDESILALARNTHEDHFLHSLITEKLAKEGVKLSKPAKQIFLDSEEACEDAYGGDWSLRLNRY
ncbi:Fis family transcriptional regulator [Neptuniibacter sp. QD37_6]|uniref:Fis family transcriptional regulator n=1 Tax=Neptuniibacter sp. QD37_6 TaxID=3398210 RepID=UPI0039F5F4C8